MLPDRSFSELFGADDNPYEAVTQTRLRNPAERRVAPRAPLETDVVVATEAQFFSGISVDVSFGGIFVATHRVLEPGTPVTLELAVPDGQVLARGTVRWLRKGGDGVVPGMGIEFEGLSEIDRELLGNYCGGRPRFYTYEEIRAAAAGKN